MKDCTRIKIWHCWSEKIFSIYNLQFGDWLSTFPGLVVWVVVSFTKYSYHGGQRTPGSIPFWELTPQGAEMFFCCTFYTHELGYHPLFLLLLLTSTLLSELGTLLADLTGIGVSDLAQMWQVSLENLHRWWQTKQAHASSNQLPKLLTTPCTTTVDALIEHLPKRGKSRTVHMKLELCKIRYEILCQWDEISFRDTTSCFEGVKCYHAGPLYVLGLNYKICNQRFNPYKPPLHLILITLDIG